MLVSSSHDAPQDGVGDGQIRALLVEDDEDDYVLTRGLLNSIYQDRCTLVWARNFDDGLSRIVNEHYDIALVDYRLGVRDGVQLIREARQKGSRLSIILLTGQNDRAVDLAATQAGASDFLSKTEVNSAMLERAIRYSMQNAKLEEQRVRLLAERSARVEAEAGNRAKDRFLATLSHELRTPLTPVMMAVTAMTNERSLSPALRQDLDMIRRNIELESRLIDDLLDITSITRGTLQLRSETLDLHRKVRLALNLCSAEIESRKLTMTLKLDAANSEMVGDVARVQQIVWNLVNNAVQYTPPGGSIEIITRNESNAIILEVRDNGIGIDSALLPRLFNAFERGDRRGNDQVNGGLGLGLSVSKALAVLHKGDLSAESDGPGKGATFKLRLPVRSVAVSPPSAPLAVSAQPPASIDQSTEKKPRILFVEDHADTAMALARVLARNGFEVRQVRTVAQAVEAVATGTFDLLISDIGLPDGSGLDVIRQAREAGKSFPAIAVSGYGMIEDVQSAREAGFDQHLTKPVHPDVLVSAVRSLVKGAR